MILLLYTFLGKRRPALWLAGLTVPINIVINNIQWIYVKTYPCSNEDNRGSNNSLSGWAHTWQCAWTRYYYYVCVVAFIQKMRSLYHRKKKYGDKNGVNDHTFIHHMHPSHASITCIYNMHLYVRLRDWACILAVRIGVLASSVNKKKMETK